MTIIKDQTPSCFSSKWRFYRNCCCRYGWLPALLAPVLTAALLLSLYSSAGCQFIDLQVGFVPSNAGWNSGSRLDMGLFFVHDPAYVDSNQLRQRWLPGCKAYGSTFVEAFMHSDRTWKVSRIMAAIAAGTGGIGFVMSWIMVFFPVPTNCLWPGLMLVQQPTLVADWSWLASKGTELLAGNIWYIRDRLQCILSRFLAVGMSFESPGPDARPRLWRWSFTEK
jgi:hypothetical protein